MPKFFPRVARVKSSPQGDPNFPKPVQSSRVASTASFVARKEPNLPTKYWDKVGYPDVSFQPTPVSTLIYPSATLFPSSTTYPG